MYLVFDIGATKIRLALSRSDGRFETPKIIPSPATTAEVIASFGVAAQELLAGETPTAVAGGVTRKHEAAKSEIAKFFSCPTYLENDAALAALGEATSGVGQSYRIVSYFTISTGVGGARVVDRRIDNKVAGFEPGKQIIDYHEPTKFLEHYISGTALEQKFHQPPTAVTDPAVWEELAQLLAIGLHNSILHWSPEVIVLGGSMMLGLPHIDLDATRRHLGQIATIFPVLPPLALATLGDFSGLTGALHFLKQKQPN